MRKRRRPHPIIHYLPLAGCFATGILYSSIGIIAILSFLKIRNGGADESSFLALLNESVAGKILIWIILAGSVGYILWRFYESVKDPYGYGKKARGIALRTGIALSTLADTLIVYSAIVFLFGMGNTNEQEQLNVQRNMIDQVLQKNQGSLFVITIGVVVAITALIQMIYGLTRGYRERLETEEFRPFLLHIVHIFGIGGYISRGIILGITAFFYLKAGFENNAAYIVNTDKAFDFIGDHIGHLYFILISIGTIFYGLFMFALGVSYDVDKD